MSKATKKTESQDEDVQELTMTKDQAQSIIDANKGINWSVEPVELTEAKKLLKK